MFIYAYIKSKTENYIVIYMGKRSDKICLLLAKHFVYMYIQSAKRAIYALNMIFINISDLLLKQWDVIPYIYSLAVISSQVFFWDVVFLGCCSAVMVLK